MSRALAQITTSTGVVAFDIDDIDIARAGPERVSRRGETIIADLDDTLEHAIAAARPAATAVLDTFRVIGPDQITVEFGLRLDVAAGAVIAKAGAEAHFAVTLQWNPTTADRPATSASPQP